MVICDVSYDEATSLVAAVSASLSKNVVSALDLLIQRSNITAPTFISSGCTQLDDALCGGLFYGSIVDICGQVYS